MISKQMPMPSTLRTARVYAGSILMVSAATNPGTTIV
jgi:hypothetical protein